MMGTIVAVDIASKMFVDTKSSRVSCQPVASGAGQRRVELAAEHHAGAGLEEDAQAPGDQRGDDGEPDHPVEGPQREPAGTLAGHRAGRDDDRGHDERHDRHLDEPDEEVADELQVARPLADDQPEDDSGDGSDADLQRGVLQCLHVHSSEGFLTNVSDRTKSALSATHIPERLGGESRIAAGRSSSEMVGP